MIIRNALSSSPEVREDIHFDTLWRQAQELLQGHSGQLWSDMAEHDPGVTLLQALTYGVSDLAYRHTLPLQDLLTPAPEEQGEDGLFPLDFGPQQALTVSPITEDDYRRALLDLADAEGTLLLRNAQLSREAEQDRYTFYFSSETREFLFNQIGQAQQLTVQGYYHLQLELNRGVTRAVAEPLVLAFLQQHRNICEGVRAIDWLAESDVDIECTLLLEDDFQDFAGLMAQVYQTVEAFISPQAERYSTTQLHAAGLNNEFLYQGPMLQHGWITRLPAPLDAQQARSISVLPLVAGLQALAGVQSMQQLRFADASRDIEIPAHACPRAWGPQPLQKLASGTAVRLMKRGQQVNLREDEILAALTPRQDLREPAPKLPFGRHRRPALYYPASDKIPPCYGLQEMPPGPIAAPLHQFLLPFEQQLASGCEQLAMLPSLLSFRRDAAAGNAASSQMWGQQWPLSEDAPGQMVHATYRQALTGEAAAQAQNVGQELALLNHLLGYFGHQRADRTLMNAPDYLASQRHYLSQNSALYYAAGQFQVQAISGIQRRIAARLGFASGLFDTSVNMAQLPFYLVEHASLLPRRPSPAYDEHWQEVSSVEANDEGSLELLLTEVVSGVYAGQLLELHLTMSDGYEVAIPACVVIAVQESNQGIMLELNAQLRGLLNELIDSHNTVKWRNSNMWLQEIHFPLTYLPDQDGVTGLPLNEGEQVITVPNFPAELMQDAQIRIYRDLSASTFALDSDPVPDGIGAKVVAVDSLRRQAVITPLDSAAELPSGGTESRYRWRFQAREEDIADRYSFTVSVVFRDDLLSSVAEPYTTAAWIRQIVQQELPCHVRGEIRWMDEQYFAEFSGNYAQWMAAGASLGLPAFNMLKMLALGLLPSGLIGINAMRIATEDQAKEVLGVDGDEWHGAVIDDNNLFYVPPDED